MAGKKFDGLNPSDGVPVKLRYDLIPPEIIEQLARIYTYGVRKYGENTWQDVPDGKNRYYSALWRHLQDYRKGENVDPDSKELHLSHALWNLGTLVWLELEKQVKENKD